MHIPQDKPQRNKILVGIALLFIITILVIFWRSVAQLKQDVIPGTGQFKTALVEQADFNHSLSAFGVLKTDSARVIMSEVDGTVGQFRLKPGAIVKPEEVIIQLINPAITHELQDAEFELKAAHAEYSLQKAAIAEQELKLRNEVQMAQADLEIMQTELAARANLAESQIISQIDFARAKLQLKKSALSHQLVSNQLDNFVKNKPIKLNAGEFQLAKAKRFLKRMQAEQAALYVTVGMEGVLQSIADDIQLGAWVTKGRKIGVVADTSSLYAQLGVNAADAALLSIGMAVQLNVKGQNVDGSVTRIAPNVVNNRVQVDAMLTSALPQTARPDVEVDAKIVIKQIPDTLILPRPAGLRKQNETVNLYVKVPNTGRYQRREVKIGAWSNNQIQVLAGLQRNEQVIITDTTGWSQQEVYLQD